MTKDEATTNAALKLALEALEHINDRFDLESVAEDATTAITAIKEALTPTSTQCEVQPEQKPVAFISPGGHIHYDPYLDSVPLYTTPPQRPWGKPWVSLTDKDYLNALDLHPYEGTDREFWKVLEAKLKEKNT